MARADRAYALLVLLALGSSAILIALLGSLLPHALDLATRGTDGADAIAVLLLLLATLGIGLGLASLFQQLLATLALIRSLLRRRVPLPPRVRAAARGLGLDGRIDMVDDPRPFSFCYWFVRPRVCVSTGLVRRLERSELRAVLLHERYHLRHRDPLRIVIARYFAAGLYVVPLVEDLVEYYALEKEIAADGEAVGSSGVGPLARALYKLLPDADAVSLGLLVPVGALSVTEARIDQLVEGRGAMLRFHPLSIALSGGALAAAATLAAGGVLPAPTVLLLAAAISGASQQLRLFARAAPEILPDWFPTG